MRTVEVPPHALDLGIGRHLAPTGPPSLLERRDDARRDRVGRDEGRGEGGESRGVGGCGSRLGGDGRARKGGRASRGGEEGLDEGDGERGVRALVDAGETCSETALARSKGTRMSEDGRTELDVLELRVFGDDGERGRLELRRSELEHVESVWLLDRKRRDAGLQGRKVQRCCDRAS